MPRSNIFSCFIMMKFGEPFDSIYTNGISPLSRVNFGYDRVSFQRADINQKGLNFLRSIWSNIKSCDFVLADISPYSTKRGQQEKYMPFNPNVFYEIGYAKALNKPTIAISHGERKRPPVNLTDCIVQWYTWGEDPDKDSDNLVSILTPALVDAIRDVKKESRILSTSYPVGCYSDRKIAGIDRCIEAARREINILQTNLETVIGYIVSIKKAIESARKEGGKIRVRILTLDPDSYFAEFRAKQLTVEVATYRQELHKHIKAFFKVLGTYPEVEIRIYDDFPTQIVFMADDNVFDCTVARGFKSRELCSFKTNLKNLGAERSFLFHFTSLWTIARTFQM